MRGISDAQQAGTPGLQDIRHAIGCSIDKPCQAVSVAWVDPKRNPGKSLTDPKSPL